ncbi:lasso peptide biosynthesis B2 protein [Solimonas sp. K1W22B-7]|uniref:lasso peptide biosynthesis B2 protein n=1 Tax=Solimonas sp. K1W22B-7 TaxID=2303331 RepID=UPI0019699277|nr:lasso peptide biosynthesis B2 protein [Solimonas sp. K1W22B-7]
MLLLLGAGRAAVLLVPFRRMAPVVGRQQGPCPWIPLLTPRQSRRADQIGRSVRLAARYAPWTANCFPQALAATAMLRLYRVPYTLHFGLRHGTDGSEMNAHAWISAGPVKVTGGASFRQFTVVGTFYYAGAR